MRWAPWISFFPSPFLLRWFCGRSAGTTPFASFTPPELSPPRPCLLSCHAGSRLGVCVCLCVCSACVPHLSSPGLLKTFALHSTGAEAERPRRPLARERKSPRPIVWRRRCTLPRVFLPPSKHDYCCTDKYAVFCPPLLCCSLCRVRTRQTSSREATRRPRSCPRRPIRTRPIRTRHP